MGAADGLGEVGEGGEAWGVAVGKDGFGEGDGREVEEESGETAADAFDAAGVEVGFMVEVPRVRGWESGGESGDAGGDGWAGGEEGLHGG